MSSPAAGLTLTVDPIWGIKILSIQKKVVIPLAFVEVQPGESFESALRRFKRKVQQEAIIKEIKKHTIYLKPGERKRLKEAQALKRMRKRMKKDLSEI